MEISKPVQEGFKRLQISTAAEYLGVSQRTVYTLRDLEEEAGRPWQTTKGRKSTVYYDIPEQWLEEMKRYYAEEGSKIKTASQEDQDLSSEASQQTQDAPLKMYGSIEQLHEKTVQLSEQILSLAKDLQETHKIITERDSTITALNNQLHNAQSALQKRALPAEIDPREAEMEAMRKEIEALKKQGPRRWWPF